MNTCRKCGRAIDHDYDYCVCCTLGIEDDRG